MGAGIVFAAHIRGMLAAVLAIRGVCLFAGFDQGDKGVAVVIGEGIVLVKNDPNDLVDDVALSVLDDHDIGGHRDGVGGFAPFGVLQGSAWPGINDSIASLVNCDAGQDRTSVHILGLSQGDQLCVNLSAVVIQGQGHLVGDIVVAARHGHQVGVLTEGVGDHHMRRAKGGGDGGDNVIEGGIEGIGVGSREDIGVSCRGAHRTGQALQIGGTLQITTKTVLSKVGTHSDGIEVITRHCGDFSDCGCDIEVLIIINAIAISTILIPPISLICDINSAIGGNSVGDEDDIGDRILSGRFQQRLAVRNTLLIVGTAIRIEIIYEFHHPSCVGPFHLISKLRLGEGHGAIAGVNVLGFHGVDQGPNG